MYSVYTTPGFIIGSRAYGEAEKIIFLFTRDFGLINVIARGIRLEKSKLRYSTQDYTFGTFSLIKGKEFWRLISVVEQENNSDKCLNTEFVVHIALLLRRLLQGEQAEPELFSYIQKGILFSRLSPEITLEQLKTLESVIVFRILELLGYIGKDQYLEEKIKSNNFSCILMDELLDSRASINSHINKALKESHL